MPSGLHLRIGSFSLPAITLGPSVGTAASNLACAHGVIGGRTFSSTPCFPSRLPLQTPDKSGGENVWASRVAEQHSSTASASMRGFRLLRIQDSGSIEE